MSGAQTSGFPNVLFNAPAAYNAAQTYQDNQLLMQQHQQAVTDHDIAAVGQAAAPLLNLSEDDAAKAYPGWLQDMQSRGLAKYAPPTYPGHATTAALVQRAMPILQQIQTGFLTTPGSADATKRLNDIYTGAGTPPATASTGGGTGAAAPATSGTIEPDALVRAQAVRDGLIARGLDVDTATGFAANALHESGANPNVGAGDAGASHGTFQWNADRLTRYQAINGHPPDNAPLDEQLDFVIHELGTTEGAARDRINAAQGPAGKAAAISQYYLRPKDVQPEMARRSATATQLATQWGGAGTSMAAPVITGDSLASSGGLGGSGVVGDSSAKVLARVQAESRAGKYDGKPVVLSTGASNDFGSDLASVEQQIREAQAGNAGKITVLGVGPAVEAKAPGTNAKLQALSKAYGADFVPLPADQMSPDGVHPTAQGYATLKAAIAPPQGAPGGVAARTGGTDVAGPGAGPGGAAGPLVAGLKYNINSQGAPAGTILGYLPNGNAVLAGPGGVPQGVTGWNADGTPVMGGSGQPPAPPVQPQAQAVPQPPANRVMPGGPDGPPAPTPPPAQQPPPSARANLPRAADVPQGANSPQIQQAQDLLHRAAQIEMAAAQNPFDKRLQADAAAKAADLKQRAQILMQTDSVVQTQEGQLHTLTGKLDESAKPLADYHETSPGSGIWVGGPGTEPKFQPPGRLIIDKAGDVWRTTTGGAEKLSRLDPTAVAALNEAAAAGTATGTAVAKQLPDLMAQARNAAAQEGQIDYASNQLREAAKGGVPSGYFSPALATAAAAAKSLGIDTSALGINPEAVGNVQTAQKTLSVIGGAILRQALGPGSAITEGKIEQFIHTQPGLETDPQALQRIMAWARSQYTYERELGHAAVSEAAKPENAGRLPPHWLPAYYRDHGFAPIYDPGTQEMRQPDGTQPPRETPPAQPSQATSPAAALPPAAVSRLKENIVTTFTNGQKWTLRNGQPTQVR